MMTKIHNSRIKYIGTCFVPSKYVLIYLAFPPSAILSDGCLQVKFVQCIYMTFNKMRRYIEIKVLKILTFELMWYVLKTFSWYGFLRDIESLSMNKMSYSGLLYIDDVHIINRGRVKYLNYKINCCTRS